MKNEDLEGEPHPRYADGTEQVTRAGEAFRRPASQVDWTEMGGAWIDVCPVAQARYVGETLAAAAAQG